MRDYPITKISEQQEKDLWSNAFFVWDTSSLCRLYKLTPAARDSVLSIMDSLKHNLWLPNRVLIEFNRHSSEELKKVLGAYDLPKFLKDSRFIIEIKQFLDGLSQESYLHPMLADVDIETLYNISKDLESSFNSFKDSLKGSLINAKKTVNDSLDDDRILTFVKGMRHGNPLRIEDIRSIIAEGDIRYKYKIPPGYKDEETKQSVDVFGDLIIWKEIINEAKVRQKPVIFITQDLKEDWNANWKDKSGQIIPREELLTEFELVSGQKFWMYTISDFLIKVRQYRAGIQSLENPFKNLEDIERELSFASIPSDCIKVECLHCNKFVGISKMDIQWKWYWFGNEDGDTDDMVTIYRLNHHEECPWCKEGIDLDFTLYLNSRNRILSVDCESDNCIIAYHPNIRNFITPPLGSLGICRICGKETFFLDDDGLCKDCASRLTFQHT